MGNYCHSIQCCGSGSGRIRNFLPVRIQIRNKKEGQMSSQTQYKIEYLISLIKLFFHLH
jgi:hypothetical protein